MKNNNHHNAYIVSTALLQSSSGQKCKTTSVQFLKLIVSSTVGVSDAPVGVVDANRLLLEVGVDLLTAGGGPSGGVGCCGAGDVAVARRLTLSGGLLSLGRAGFSRREWLVGQLLLGVRDGPDPKGGELLSLISVHLQPLWS